jgi:hypothetical protein
LPAVSCSDQVHYLSEVDPAYNYLEAMQENVYRNNPGITDPFSREELNTPRGATTLSELAERLAKQGCDPDGKNCVGDIKLYKRMLEQLRCQNLPTRFESPLFIQLIDLYTRELDVVRQRDYPKSQVARFGSLPTRTIDGQAMLPKNIDQPIVILNRDAFRFTGAFSKSISDAIPIGEENGMVGIHYSPDAIAQRLKENPYIVRNFADAMSRMVQAKSPNGAEEAALDADHNRLHARLVAAMDMFIISHEEAHVLLHHVNDGRVLYSFGSAARPAADQGGSKQEVDPAIVIQMRTRREELEADALGYKLMVETLGGGKADRDPIALIVGAAAPHMVFRIIDAADTYGRAANGRSFSDANHPAADDRIKSLDPIYRELSDPGSLLNGTPDFRMAFDASLEALLKAADPLIRQNLNLPAAAR